MNTFELEKKKHEELNERKDFLATKLAETIKIMIFLFYLLVISYRVR